MKTEIFPFDNDAVSRDEFVAAVSEAVLDYINNFYNYDGNAMLRVNPDLKQVEIENGYAFQNDIEYSDEVVEQAAYAEGDATESDTDNQARQNYDYYPVRKYIVVSDGKGSLDKKAVEALADRYYK